MKTIVSGVLCASLVLCGAGCGGGASDAGDSGDGDGGGSDGGGGDVDAGGGGDPFDPAALEAEVGFLASDEMRGRLPGRPEDVATRMHIADRFAALGLTPVAGSFQQPFVDSIGRETANVVGLLAGADPAVADQIIVIGAHHDHLGVRQGKIFNGANDNASGVATVLAVAQAVRQRAEPPRRTIVFSTFGSEELGLEGSYHFVENPPAGISIEDVVYMINLDMVGTYFNDDGVYAFGSFEGTPARAALDELLADHPDLTVELGASAVEVEGEGDSDYDAFCQAGIPYLYFFTEDDECYHR
ncbi:MAG TPA: M28 family peptidase, partial [Kofleriaceae bacterium]|nr:M28 family peptidase [Kofleriaceae bacterium]